MTGAATPAEPTFPARARDLFLLKSAERMVRGFTPEQHAVVRKHFDAAQRRASVADDLSDDRNAAVAYVLYRDAVTLLISALVASRSPSELGLPGLHATTAFDRLYALANAGHIPQLPPFVAEARQVLSEEEQLAFDRHAPEDLLGKRKYVEQTLRWLTELIEPRTLSEIRATRLVRLFTSVAIVASVTGYLVVKALQPVNIALGKPVTVSAKYPHSTAPADNSGVVNGDVESGYGIHTAIPAPGTITWVMIDLTQPTSFKRIKIFNRADMLFDDQLPLTLELSDDATNFNVADTRTTGYTSRSPWVYEPPGGARARYVRLRSNNYIAITEIEINP